MAQIYNRNIQSAVKREKKVIAKDTHSGENASSTISLNTREKFKFLLRNGEIHSEKRCFTCHRRWLSHGNNWRPVKRQEVRWHVHVTRLSRGHYKLASDDGCSRDRASSAFFTITIMVHVCVQCVKVILFNQKQSNWHCTYNSCWISRDCGTRAVVTWISNYCSEIKRQTNDFLSLLDFCNLVRLSIHPLHLRPFVWTRWWSLWSTR